MTTQQAWTYYTLGNSPRYVRYRPVEAQSLNQRDLVWVEANALMMSRYIENGETDLDQITRAEIEQRLGAIIPAREVLGWESIGGVHHDDRPGVA